jgi:hypothetical protein
MSALITSTLAVQALKVSSIGSNIYLAEAATGGAADLAKEMGGALGILNLIGLVLAFGGLLFAAVMFMMGQTERMIYGLIGALIGGLAFLIVKAMFKASGAADVETLKLGFIMIFG